MDIKSVSIKALVNELESRAGVKSTRLTEEESAKVIVSGIKGRHERYIRAAKCGIILILENR